jgi:hypothetical protein
MGIYANVYSALKSALENNAVLKTYVKAVYGGVRTDIPKTMMPCLIIEPLGVPENWIANPNRRKGIFKAEIHCVLEIFDNDKQLVTGETVSKGVIEFAEDVLNAIDADLTLGGKCSTCQAYIPDGGFVYDTYPSREIYIVFEAELDFLKGAR